MRLKTFLASVLFLYLPNSIYSEQTTFIEMDVPTILPAQLNVPFIDQGQRKTLNLQRISRSPRLQVVVPDKRGGVREIIPPEPRVYSGYIEGEPETRVVAGMKSTGMHVYIMDTPPERQVDIGEDFYEVELAMDIDYSYYETVGGSTDKVMEKIDFSMALMQNLYLRELHTRFDLFFIIIREDKTSCPYYEKITMGGHVMDMWLKMKDVWNKGGLLDSVKQDVAALITAYEPGSGVAHRPALCREESSYIANSIDAGNYTGEDHVSYQVLRHEMGHAFGARDWHDPNAPGRTIMCGNDLDYFSPVTIADIAGIREEECIENLGPDTGVTYIGHAIDINRNPSIRTFVSSKKLTLSLEGYRFALELFDIQGRLLMSVPEQKIENGSCSITWDGKKDLHASGVYFLKVILDGKAYTRQFTMVK